MLEPGAVLRRTRSSFLFYKAGPSPQTWSGFEKALDPTAAESGRPGPPPAGTLGPIKNKPIQLADGALLAGRSVEVAPGVVLLGRALDRRREDVDAARPDRRAGEPNSLIQPTLLEARRSTSSRAARHGRIGFVCMAESRDAGLTWGEASRSGLSDLNPSSGIDAVRPTRATAS